MAGAIRLRATVLGESNDFGSVGTICDGGPGAE